MGDLLHSPPPLHHPTKNTLLMRGQPKATGLHLLGDNPEGSLAPAPADTRPSSSEDPLGYASL